MEVGWGGVWRGGVWCGGAGWGRYPYLSDDVPLVDDLVGRPERAEYLLQFLGDVVRRTGL